MRGIPRAPKIAEPLFQNEKICEDGSSSERRPAADQSAQLRRRQPIYDADVWLGPDLVLDALCATLHELTVPYRALEKLALSYLKELAAEGDPFAGDLLRDL